MTNLDLTEAVEAAAQALFPAQFPDALATWDDLPPMAKHAIRERLLPGISTAAPLIAAQVREQTVREVARHLDREGYALPAGLVLNTFAAPAPTDEDPTP